MINDIDQIRQGRTLVVSTGEDCDASQLKEHLEDGRLLTLLVFLEARAINCDQTLRIDGL